MNFTDSPYEKIMKRVLRSYRPEVPKAPFGSICYGCTFWRGMACVGICYKEFMEKEKPGTSGHVGPKLSL